MGQLFVTIKRLVASERYVVSQHAAERLEERGVLEWQVVEGISHGALLAEFPDARPNPLIEVEQLLADGAKIKAMWSHIVFADIAKLVTVHFFDR